MYMNPCISGDTTHPCCWHNEYLTIGRLDGDEFTEMRLAPPLGPFTGPAYMMGAITHEICEAPTTVWGMGWMGELFNDLDGFGQDGTSYTPILINHDGHGGSGMPAANDQICCINNQVNSITLESQDDTYWTGELLFCDRYNQPAADGVDVSGCRKTLTQTYDPSGTACSNCVEINSTELWDIKHANLGVNKLDPITNSDNSHSLLCGVGRDAGGYPNGDIMDACTCCMAGTDAGDAGMTCECPGPTAGAMCGDATIDDWPYCFDNAGAPCAQSPNYYYCDTQTWAGGNADVVVGCNGGGEVCACGFIDVCDECRVPGDTEVDPCCGAPSDACGICNGDAFYGEYSNRYYITSIVGTLPENPETICHTDEYDEDGSTSPQFCWCDCGSDDSYTGAVLPTMTPCYDASGASGDETVDIPICPAETCDTATWPPGDPDGAGRWSSNEEVVFNQGCRDSTACNYDELAEIDCNNDEYGTNYDCCVYPVQYCIADGSLYGEGSAAEEAGSNDLCDVCGGGDGECTGIEDGLPVTITYCPQCDCQSTNCDTTGDGVPDGPCDCPVECGTTGYNSTDYNSSDYGQTPLGWLIITGQCNQSPCYQYSGVGAGEAVPATMLDTCTGSCGLAGDGEGTGFALYGCDDHAALNHESENPLHTDPDEDLTNASFAMTEAPVTTCQYCPGGDYWGGDEIGAGYSAALGCPAGYEFYWDAHTPGATSAAVVTDASWDDPSNFDLRLMLGLDISTNLQSTVLQYGMASEDFQHGHCYCRTDLDFIKDMVALVADWVIPLPSDPWLGALQLNLEYGYQTWNGNGRLQEFSTGGVYCYEDVEVCRESRLRLGMNSAENTLPTSLTGLKGLQYLDLSKNYIEGTIPQSIAALKETIQYLDFSYNNLNLPFDQSVSTGHGINLGATYYGICEIAHPDYLGFPGEPNPWLLLKGNQICPKVASDANNTMSYPECLAPTEGYAWGSSSEHIEWCEWIYQHLGYADIPCYDNYNESAQNLFDEVGDLICDITGCTDPEALNYWPQATDSCDNCCSYDRYLHFPWGSGGEQSPDGESPGGGLSLYQMVQALHADIYGFKYNAWGEMDVTNNSITLSDISANDAGCLEASLNNAYGAYLTTYQINACDYNYTNDPSAGGSLSEYYDGNGIMNHWDGLWLRDAGYNPLFTDEPLMGYCKVLDATNNLVDCAGDSRPLEFINRVEWAAQVYGGGNPSSYRDYWFSFFPPSGQDTSFSGIQYLEDFDLDGNGQLGTTDAAMWELIGRGDIAALILNSFQGMAYPESAPEEVELWEQAPAMVSMSYSQEFVTEENAGFTLYASETSPGILTRNGQWYCDDGGPSTVCYEDLYSCGRAPYWVEECTPCGNGSGTCVPITLKTSAEGHDRISKEKMLQIPYFSGQLSSTLLGSQIYTSSLSSSNAPYYYPVLSGDALNSDSLVEFDVSWGHYLGSGSDTKGDTVIGTSQGAYRQYSSLLLDSPTISPDFLISSGSDIDSTGVDGNIDRWVYVLNFKRKNFEDQLQVGNWTLHLSGANAAGAGKIVHLTDNSKALTSPAVQSAAGRRYDIVSGSNGNVAVGGDNNRYGWFYPDFGIMVFGEKVTNELPGNTATPAAGIFGSTAVAHNQLTPNTSSDADYANSLRFVNCMKNVKDKGFHESSYVPDVQITGSITASNGSNQISGSSTLFQTDLQVPGHTHIKIESGSYSQIMTMDTYKSETSMSTNEVWAGGAGDWSGSLGYKISPIPALNLYGEKEVTEVIYAIRLAGDSFNFTNNFTIISASGRQMYAPGVGSNPDVGVMDSFNTSFTSSAFTASGDDFTSSYVYGEEPIETQTTLENGEPFIWPGSNVTTMHGDPHTFITGVEMYDEHGEMVAVARPSSPIKKAFDREVVIKIKLTF